MNKNMQAIMAAIQGLRTIDSWPESEAKSSLIKVKESLEGKFKFVKRLDNKIMYADPLGNPISLFEWCVCGESIERHVGEDYLEVDGNRIHVSTVWMGLNHSWYQGLKIFETMIFGIEDNEDLNCYQERYATLSEAEEGHKKAVELVLEYSNAKAAGRQEHNHQSSDPVPKETKTSANNDAAL